MTQNFQPGLIHAPVTPFTARGKVDYDAFAKLADFHLRHGAQSLAVQMHTGESVSLTDAEQRKLVALAVEQARERGSVVAHVSDSGTSIAAARARHAEAAGAAAIVATTPYYWTPPPGMVLEHLAQIGGAVSVPFYVFYTPGEMGGTKLSTELVLKLVERLPNFAGVVDASLDWQFMINVISNAQRARPAFRLVSGTEYMISAGAIGATAMVSSLAGVAPVIVRELWDLCRAERYADARPVQEALAALRQAVKAAGFAGLKGALRELGRDCGKPRAPNEPLNARTRKALAAALAAIPALAAEPRGW